MSPPALTGSSGFDVRLRLFLRFLPFCSPEPGLCQGPQHPSANLVPAGSQRYGRNIPEGFLLPKSHVFLP